MARLRASIGQLFNNPILVGTITILIGAVAVYLSYIAENGLPFIPNYEVKVDVPNADELGKNADVRIGGARVGQVLTVTPETAATDPHQTQPFARLTLQLQESLDPLPYDTTYEIRLASVLGGKYLELFPGNDRNTPQTPALPDGGTFQLGTKINRNQPVVDIDTAFRTFGPKTQAGLRDVVGALGDAVAGRGAQFNDATYELNQLIGPLEHLLGVVAAPDTQLSRFITGAAGTTSALAAVAPTVSSLLSDGATTFQALNSSALGETIDQLPGTEAVGTTVLANARPVLGEASNVLRELEPATALLPTAAQQLDHVIRAATPVFKLTPPLAAKLQTALVDVDHLAANPASTETFKVLGDNDLATLGASAFVGLGAILEVAAPAQLGCNTTGVWANNIGASNGIAAEGDPTGTWLRATLVVDPSTLLESPTPATNLHDNYYPNETKGNCTAGNENYETGQDIGQPVSQANVVPTTTPPPGVLEREAQAHLTGTYGASGSGG